uniref:hypothetical protein n=1 Tax=Salmonella sp. s55004 TaxID=3159675 RepID=UPI00397EEEF6
IRGQQISRLARNRFLWKKQQQALSEAEKRAGDIYEDMEKRNLSQNDLSQFRARYLNQKYAHYMMSQLMGNAGR